MQSGKAYVSLFLCVGALFVVGAGVSCAQANPVVNAAVAQVDLPDAPGYSSSNLQEQSSTGSAGSTKQASTAQNTPDKTQRERAEEQIRAQEHQRVLGIIPAFNTSYVNDAVSLTAKQKIELAFRSAVDPVTFGAAFVVAGYHEANDDESGFGWGPAGYGKRVGAAYLDSFDGTIIGNGILPAVLHQDPRYFRLGHGPTRHRLLYAMAMTVVCKHDNTGKWEPNYSNVAGNIISGGISNLYYPSDESGIGQTISNGMIVTAEGTIGAVFQEFWPDISRKLFHKDPTHGLDAKAQAEDSAKKQKQPLTPVPK